MPSANHGAMDNAKRAMTTRAERLAMLKFLRVPKHFALMTDQATKGKAMKGGQRLMKAHGHSLMAQYVNYICPYYNDMNALFGERQNFRPSYTLETNNHVDGSQTLDNSFVADDSDDNDAKDGEQPGNDPDSDEYWAQNDVEDPGRTDADAAVGGKANKRPDVPRVFPTPEKRLTPRKDFSSIYMDAQIQAERQARPSPLEEAITVLAYNSQAGVTGVEGVVTVLVCCRQPVGNGADDAHTVESWTLPGHPATT
ncbi:hypothetical protein H257_09976 [Aphanomyces astaci]|uniref:Uncharacterized protein n=1 Tax=Aphanomyces astaci TaxID=112090 RepID=W4GAQ7_APHAT|nr:hypothetical protein H257_09976 [Aphanomyces astaci]ETV76033.1 hypothetical protein H257_09976 [Aphanomyces astaci]|eukprot:XP_009834675.1 hypothetical protein H257_09976 [Aphanomyces astaci]